MKILAIGLSVYDISVALNEPLILDEKYRVSDRYECVGGQASNAACVCAKWKKDTYMISRIGDDASGNAILSSYQEVGLHTQYMKVLSNFKTSSSIIINHQDCGKRTILNQQDTMGKISFSLPSQADFILFDAHEEETSLKALESFPNAQCMLDAERANQFTLQLAEHMDYIVGSERFAKEFTQLNVCEENYEAIIQKIKKLNNKHVVITLGSKGLIYEEKGIVKHMPAFCVNVVDTTGAGDIFHGALLYAISEKMEWVESLRFASLASALSIQQKGGFTSIPTLDEMKKAFHSYKQ